MRVGDAADRIEFAVQQHVRRRVARRAQFALDHFTVQIDDDHVRRIEFIVRHAAGLDHDQPLLAIDATHVTPGQRHQALGYQFPVGAADFLFEYFEHQ